MTIVSDEPADGSAASSTPADAQTPTAASSAPESRAENPAEARTAPRIRIGSQRSAVEIERSGLNRPAAAPQAATPAPAAPAPASPAAEVAAPAAESAAAEPVSPAAEAAPTAEAPAPDAPASEAGERPNRAKRRERPRIVEPESTRHVPIPNLRADLPPEWEQEVADALGDMSLDDLLVKSGSSEPKKDLAPETRMRGRVVSMHRDNVFIDLDQRYQGVLSLRQFAQPPENGAIVDVQVVRFEPEEGLYQLTLPGAAVDVGNWADVSEGMIVQARVTGHNKGGLECDVNSLRGFIPAGQVSVYRIEDLSTCVGESWPCVVTEANPEKRNLVLSRRAVLEREQAEARTKMLAELEPGAVRDGTVRSVQDFGAFVDLGGVDGLVHVSQLSWNRVKHPSEVVKVGDKVTVKVQKIDHETGKISLSMKELADNPWNTVATRYSAKSTHQGKVSKLMEFGAFVELEPGVEGLIHISELDHKRVFRTKDVLSEGETVDVQVLSVDVPTRRISLSRKALLARAEPIKKVEEPEVELPPLKKSNRPLKGGRASPSGGEQFGLKW